MVTQSRDLRTGRTVWQDRRAVAVETAPLRRDIAADVAIVGAGITGGLIAQALAAEGLTVAILDRRGAVKGSTVASTALVQYDIDMPLTHLTRRIGIERARRAWRRSRLAVESLAAVLGAVGLRDVARRDTLYLAGNLLDPDALARESDARRAAGLETTMLTAKELRERFGIRARAAALGYGNLAIDPRQAAILLLRDAVAHGAKIYAPVEVIDIDAGSRGGMASTADGKRIRAEHLVLASGYEFPDCVPRRGHKIISTYAIATPPQRARLWSGEALIWEAADPYLYIRATPDGRVICGGEDEEFSDDEKRDALIARKTRTLQRKLARRIPGLDTRVDYAWAGAFGQSATGLPSIGEVPGMPRVWAALGYGGNGITYARIAAEVIRGALCGRDDADADLYAFPRPRD